MAGLHSSTIWQQLQHQESLGRKRSALITDIDNTFYRAGHEEAIKAAWDMRARASKAPYPIIAVTGADYEALVKGRLESGELPIPEVVVTSVGTEIWFLQVDGTFKKDETYDKLLQATGYNRTLLLESVAMFLAQLRKKGLTIDFQDPAREAAYRKKPDQRYLPYKIGLHFYAEEAAADKVASLFVAKYDKLKIVVCEEIHYNAKIAPTERIKKFCLDIMPVTKADAANYLISMLDLEQGVVAGDSGNDIDMLLETPPPFVAVAVGGHKTELQKALRRRLAKTSDKQIFIDTHHTRVAAQTLLLFDDYLSGKTEAVITPDL
ncbi:MAG TPA: HAD family hydrolase [Candidatus Saccharimonadales bacterium]|nr:HAD family hydrolase [Candidatus Saccharimonadales bacterium]